MLAGSPFFTTLFKSIVAIRCNSNDDLLIELVNLAQHNQELTISDNNSEIQLKYELYFLSIHVNVHVPLYEIS